MIKITNQENLSKTLIVKDSYFNALIDFITPCFKESVILFDAWKYQRHLDIIEKEQPNLVILEIYEPHIRNLVNDLQK